MESGNYNLMSLFIGGADFRQGYKQVVFYEDIFSNEMSGFIDIIETESVREYFQGLPDGIIGEEYLTLSFASRFPNGTQQDTITKVFWINKLEEYAHNSLPQRTYRLHFISTFHQANYSNRNRKIWEGKADEIVNSIVTSQMGGSMNQIDPAKYKNEYIFPNWTPYQVANFLSTVAISSAYNDPKYLFYECRDGFNFVSLSHLMDKPISHTMTATMFTHGATDVNRFNIQTYASRALFDNAMNEFTGMYGNTFISYDKINKEFEETTQTYTGSWGKFKHVGENKLTKKFSESPKNRFQFMSINKEDNPGIYSHTDEWTKELLNRSNQPKNNVFTVTYTGNTSLKVGTTIEFDIKSTKDDGQNPDRMLSGKYLITRIKHTILKDDYTSVVEIVKDGYAR